MDKSLTEIESQVISLTHQFLLESGAERAARAVSLDARLEHDLGIGSLEKAELFSRIEKSLGVELPESLLVKAKQLNDVVKAVKMAEPTLLKVKREVIAPLKSTRTDPSKVETLVELLNLYAQNEPDRPHIYFQNEFGEETIIRYGELYTRAKEFAQGLVGKGLKPSETVAIMLPTSADFFYSFLGTLMAGGIPVPIYPPFRADQIEEYAKREAFILHNAGVRFLITFKRAAALSKLLQSFVPSLLEVTTVKALTDISADLPTLDIEATDPVLIQYTSGSTGNPKGVLLNHANLLANISAYGKTLNMQSTDAFVSWLPLYHDMGLIGAWMGSFYHGLPLTLLSPFTFLSRPEKWLWAIHYHRGTISPGPNFAYDLCVKKIEDSDLEGLDLSSWRVALNGSEMIHPDTLRNFEKRFRKYGFKKEAIFPAYGLAECALGLTFPPLNRGPNIDRIERLPYEKNNTAVPLTTRDKKYYEFVSCGSVLEGHEIRIVDDNDNRVAERTIGNIQFKGPSAMQGYYRNSEATMAIYHNGWWATGDLGYLAEGELFITGRKKDLIIKAGRNYHPTEIEAMASLAEGVRKSCVAAFGVADEKRGTEKLIIVAETKEDKKIHPEIKKEIVDKVISQIGIPPDEILLVPPHTLPKTSSGKLRRSSCKQDYLAGKLSRPSWSAFWQTIKLFIKSRAKKIEKWLINLIKVVFSFYVLILLFFTLLPVWLLVIILPRKKAAAAFRFWARSIFRLIFSPISIKGKENISGQPMIYVANHGSFIDSVILAGVLPADTNFIGKKELLKTPVIKSFVKQLDLVTVDRMDFSKSHSDVKRIEQTLEQGRSVLIFPEGTFSYATDVRPFKLGAFKIAAELGKPICPVAIVGARKILRANQFLVKPAKLEVIIFKPLIPESKEWEEVMRLRKQSRFLIAKYSGEHVLDLVSAGVLSESE
ncbi:AMP-binding protein [Coxiella burnetii]|uniref:AMP-binding protein n=1 Tax=Coxiella burnetii TaxID=777 RepID=UPI00039F8FB3|nr:AMP-binding protein [Coxiella burnetii]